VSYIYFFVCAIQDIPDGSGFEKVPVSYINGEVTLPQPISSIEQIDAGGEALAQQKFRSYAHPVVIFWQYLRQESFVEEEKEKEAEAGIPISLERVSVNA